MTSEKPLFEKIETNVLIASMMSINDSVLEQYHNTCELAYFEHADLKVFCHNRWYDVRDNMLMWIPEYQLHRIEYRECEMYRRTVTHIRSSFLFEAICSLGLESLLSETKLSHFRLIHLTQEEGKRIKTLLEICEEYSAAYNATPSKNNAGMLRNSLITLLSRVFSLQEDEDISRLHMQQNHVRILTHYIDAHFNEDITLEKLAAIAHLDKHYMCHMFKKQMNMTVIRYVQYRRVIEAQKRLLFTDMPITAIAAECGFNSIQYFYKVFHDISGYTPGDYNGQNAGKHTVN